MRAGFVKPQCFWPDSTGHWKCAMCESRGAHLSGLTQKKDWDISGERLGLGQLDVLLLMERLSNLCVGESTALSCCCAFELIWRNPGKTGNNEEKTLPYPVGTGTWRQTVAEQQGCDLIKDPASSYTLLSFPLLLQQKNGKRVELCVRSKEQLTLSCQWEWA